MQASKKNMCRFCLYIVIILLLFTQGCSPKIPLQTVPLSTTETPTTRPPTITASPIPPTATFIPPTATPLPPTPFPAEYTFPRQFLARLTMGMIEAFSFSPQADRLAVASATHTCLYATASYEQQWCSQTVPQIGMITPEGAGLQEKVNRLVFRPDGQMLAMVLWNGYILIFDTSNGDRTADIQTGRVYISDLAWSSDGKQIMVTSPEGGIEVWTADSGAFVKQLEIDPESIGHSAWSADGSMLATSKDNIIRLWDTSTLTTTYTIDTQLPGWVNRMIFSPDNQHLYAAIATPFPCEELCDPNDPEYKGWVVGWSLQYGYISMKTRVSDIITSLSLSPDGTYLAAGGELKGSFIVMRGGNGSMQARLSDTRAGKGIGWLDNNRALYLPDPKHFDAMSISEWDVLRSEHQEISLPGFETIYSVAWLPDGERLITNSAGGTVSIWQARTGLRLDQFVLTFDSLPITEFNPAWMSPTDPLLAVVINDKLALVDPEKQQVTQWVDHQDIASKTWIVRLAWSMDGQRLVAELGNRDATGDLTVVVWDIHSGERLYTFSTDHLVEINSMSFSPNGKLLAMSQWIRDKKDDQGNYVRVDQYRLVLISLETGEEVNALNLESSSHDLFWLNQDQIAYDHCENMHVWDLVNNSDSEMAGSQVFPAVRMDGKLAANACNGVGIRLWSTNTGEELACLKIQPDEFAYRGLAFNRQGTYLSSLTDNGSLLTWDVSDYHAP